MRYGKIKLINFAIIISSQLIGNVFADNITINNNNNAPAPSMEQPTPSTTCNPTAGSQSYGTNTPPGTYEQTNGNGTSSTVYTTGDKQPYIVDNNCDNSSPIPQPYVYVQPPFNGSGTAPRPVPTPGPVPGPRR